jgi:hypothetical protein
LTSTSKDYTAYTRGADQLRVAEVATPKLEAPEQNGIELCPTDAAGGTFSEKTEGRRIDVPVDDPRFEHSRARKFGSP